MLMKLLKFIDNKEDLYLLHNTEGFLVLEKVNYNDKLRSYELLTEREYVIILPEDRFFNFGEVNGFIFDFTVHDYSIVQKKDDRIINITGDCLYKHSDIYKKYKEYLENVL